MNDWSNAEEHAERAQRFYEAGMWEKALASLRRALAVQPENADWLYGLGLTLDALERYDEAIIAYERALAIREDDIGVLLNLAVDLLRTEQPRRAIERLEQVSRIDPDCEQAYCHRIWAYRELGDHEMAEQMFYMARQITDECPTCLDQIARSLMARGEVDRAVWCWQQALRLDPHYPEVYANLAHVHWERGQLERARQLFLQQLRDDPGSIDTLLDLGELLMQMGRKAEAGEKFRRVLELDATVAEAHLHLGQLAYESGHLEAATAELQMAGNLDPQCPGVHLYLARVAQQRGRLDLARQHLANELQFTQPTPEATLEVAKALIELQMAVEAVKLLTPMVRMEPGVEIDNRRASQVLLYRGAANLLLSDLDAAVLDCRRALRLDPRCVAAMYNLVVAYIRQASFARARYWLNRATELCPDDRDLRELRRQLLRAQISHSLRAAKRRLLSFF